MELIINWFQHAGLDFRSFILTVGAVLFIMLLTGTVGRIAFGKRSVLGCTVSSSIAILFIYALNIILSSADLPFEIPVAPLPFVTVFSTHIELHALQGDFYAICAELLNMFVLALLVNLIDSWLPRGKNIFAWLFYRVLTIAAGIALYILAVYLFDSYIPTDIRMYAPVIILGILVLLILTGALKVPVGVLLTSVNPVIAALYTFFFANIIGRQITEAVLTTAIIAGLIYLLNYWGIFTVLLLQSALIAYIPFALALVALWFLANKVF